MIVIAAFILGLFIISSTGVLSYVFIKLDKSSTARKAAMKTLIDLVERLNEEFPDSNLIIQDDIDSVKVIGELKYYKKV